MLEELGSRGDQAGSSLTELIGGVEALRNMAGNGGGLTGLKDVLEIADRINAVRGNGQEEDSWLGVLIAVAPGLAQTVAQILVARNGSMGGTAGSSAAGGDEFPPPPVHHPIPSRGRRRGTLVFTHLLNVAPRFLSATISMGRRTNRLEPRSTTPAVKI